MNRAELLRLLELLTKAMAEKHHGARTGLLRLACQRVADAVTDIDTASLHEVKRLAGLEPGDG